LYTGVRITCEVVTTATGVIHATNTLSAINSLIVDVPEYGSRSRRVDVDGNTKVLLGSMCQLGAINQDHAETATGINAATGADNVAGYSYFDIPTVKQNLNEDTRITINASGTHADRTLRVSFAFLDKPFRNVYFRSYNHAASASNVTQWFPTDGVLQGIFLGTTDGTPAVADVYKARDPVHVDQISYNGEQATTFSEPGCLGAGMDEAVGSDSSYGVLDTFAMLANFPASQGSNYVEVNPAASNGFLILGVMSDAN
jgi:hypothetical protein